MCLGVTPKPGVSYEDARAAVFSRVDWPERELRWIDARRAPCDDAPEGWIVECTCSCLAHGDEVQVAYRVEGLAADVVEEAEVIVSAPCHIPLLELTLDDAAPRTVRAWSVLAANCGRVRAGVRIAAGAEVDDGVDLGEVVK